MNQSVQFLLCFREDSFQSALDSIHCVMTMMNFILDEHQSESTTRKRQVSETTTISTNIHQNATNGCDLDDDFLLFEGLIDDSSSIGDSNVSSYEQLDENITTVSTHENKRLILLSILTFF